MASTNHDIDQYEVRKFAEHVHGIFGQATIAAMIYLGDDLGLYRVLHGGGPMTSDELAQRSGLQKRWVREWLYAQASARLVDYKGGGHFQLSKEAGKVLADEDSLHFEAGRFSQLPSLFAVLPKLREAFSTGIGLPFDAFGLEMAIGAERDCAPWVRSTLIPNVLPRLDDVVAKLEAGANVADIGCGTGAVLMELAKAYQRSTFHGYDISRSAIGRARKNLAKARKDNKLKVKFHEQSADSLQPGRFDVITSINCVHDMTNPEAFMRAVHRALKPDGTWLLVDVKGEGTFIENLEKNPRAAMLYSLSVLVCMSSGLSEPDGAGLGALGFTEPVAREMKRKAGFTRFTRHEIDDDEHIYYELRH